MRPMAGLRHVLLAAVFAALQLSNGVLSQVTQCVFPTSSIIGTPLLSAIRSSGGEGGSVQVVTILDMQVTCLAVNEKDVYRQASVVVRYDTDLSSMTNVTGHLTIECGSDDLYIPNGDIEPNVPESLFNTPTRYDCAACLTSAAPGAGTYDPDTNCIECSEACSNSSRGACNSQGTTCCSVFLPDRSCSQTCPQHFVATADTNFSCVCNLTCMNGGVLEGACSCNCAGTGYQGLTCSEDINECDMSPCENGGSCSNSIGNFTCSCSPGFTGRLCEINIDECMPNPCVNGGSCTDGINAFQCSCVPGYTGDTCATDINECSPNPCRNGGTCTDQVNDYTCACVSSYTGRTCEADVNECDNSPCEHSSPCANTIGSFSCDCPPRWGGQKCDQCNIPNCTSCENLESRRGANCVRCADGYRKLQPGVIFADRYRIDEDQIGDTADFICIRNCSDSWCVDCPDLTKCLRCQETFRLTSDNGCTIKGTLPTEAVLAIFVSLIAFVVLVVVIIVIVGGIWLVHYNRTAPIGYSAAKKDPGDVKKELVLTKISEL